jgi:hypothetical protein
MSIILLATVVIAILNVFIVKSAFKNEGIKGELSVKEYILDDGEINSL